MDRPTEAVYVLSPESLGPKNPLALPGREYHVTFDGRHWNVGTDDGDAGPSSFDRHMALTLAIRAAQHDYADGMDVTVCVEEQDGTFRLAWAPA